MCYNHAQFSSVWIRNHVPVFWIRYYCAYYFFHFTQADPRLVWNKNLLEELIEAKVNIYEGTEICVLWICLLAYILTFFSGFCFCSLMSSSSHWYKEISKKTEKIMTCYFLNNFIAHMVCVYCLCVHNISLCIFLSKFKRCNMLFPLFFLHWGINMARKFVCP